MSIPLMFSMGLKSKLMNLADHTKPPQHKSVVLKVLMPLLLIEFALAIAWGWMLGNHEDLHIGRWQIAEWLINYQAGFVRRGLSGQVVYLLGNGQNLLQILYSLTIFFYIVYTSIFVALYFLAKVNNVRVLLLAILLPGSLFQMGMTIQFFTRKEILFLILFGLLCLQYVWMRRTQSLSDGKQNQHLHCQLFWMYAIAIAGGALMTLVHEGYVFMSYPLTFLLLWVVKKECPQSALAKWGVILYGISIPAIFLVCAMHRGDAVMAQAVWESLSLNDRLKLANPAPYTAFGPIASLGWGFQQNLLTIYGVFVTGGWKYWLLYLVGNGLILGIIANQINLGLNLDASGNASAESNTHSRYLGLVLLGLLVSSSMFIVAADWGRWIAYIGNSLLLWMFTLKQSSYAQELKHVAPTTFLSAVNAFFKKILTSPALFFLALIYAIIFRLPECCVNPDFIFMPYGRIFGGL